MPIITVARSYLDMTRPANPPGFGHGMRTHNAAAMAMPTPAQLARMGPEQQRQATQLEKHEKLLKEQREWNEQQAQLIMQLRNQIQDQQRQLDEQRKLMQAMDQQLALLQQAVRAFAQ